MSAASNLPAPDLPALNLLASPPPHGHYVQLYDRDVLPLLRNAARYLSEGFKHGEAAIAIVTPDHRETLIAAFHALGVDSAQAVCESRLLLLDAAKTLAEFMVDGQPDHARFEAIVQRIVSHVDQSAPTGLRAYGEMVGVLWTRQEYAAAVRLEGFWNRLLEREDFSLYCSYPIDIFGRDFQISTVDSLLCDHTHLIPTGTEEALEGALNRAMDELLGPEAPAMKLLMKANYRPAWAVLPAAEAMILWVRNNLPRRADAILDLARTCYQQSAAISAVVE